MTTSAQSSSLSAIAASRLLWSIAATVVLASITHAYEFGAPAFAVGAIVIALLSALSGRYRRTGTRPALVIYGLLNLWIIGAFGLVGGLWNHAFKVVVSAAHGGALPPALEPFFMSPDLGSATYEAIGILTFGASLCAAYFGYRFARMVRLVARADAPGRDAGRSSPAADV